MILLKKSKSCDKLSANLLPLFLFSVIRNGTCGFVVLQSNNNNIRHTLLSSSFPKAKGNCNVCSMQVLSPSSSKIPSSSELYYKENEYDFSDAVRYRNRAKIPKHVPIFEDKFEKQQKADSITGKRKGTTLKIEGKSEAKEALIARLEKEIEEDKRQKRKYSKKNNDDIVVEKSEKQGLINKWRPLQNVIKKLHHWGKKEELFLEKTKEIQITRLKKELEQVRYRHKTQLEVRQRRFDQDKKDLLNKAKQIIVRNNQLQDQLQQTKDQKQLLQFQLQKQQDEMHQEKLQGANLSSKVASSSKNGANGEDLQLHIEHFKHELRQKGQKLQRQQQQENLQQQAQKQQQQQQPAQIENTNNTTYSSSNKTKEELREEKIITFFWNQLALQRLVNAAKQERHDQELYNIQQNSEYQLKQQEQIYAQKIRQLSFQKKEEEEHKKKLDTQKQQLDIEQHQTAKQKGSRIFFWNRIPLLLFGGGNRSSCEHKKRVQLGLS